MKNTSRIIKTLFCVFIALNTAYFWEDKVGILLIPITLLVILLYLVSVCVLILIIYKVLRENFSSKQKNLEAIYLFLILLLIIIKPDGFINFDKFYGKDLLIAQREGAANCNVVFKLKGNNRFIETGVCFGIDRIRGYYEIKKDTIWLYEDKENTLKYGYAVADSLKWGEVGKEKYDKFLMLYRNDSTKVNLVVDVNKIFAKLPYMLGSTE